MNLPTKSIMFSSIWILLRYWHWRYICMRVIYAWPWNKKLSKTFKESCKTSYSIRIFVIFYIFSTCYSHAHQLFYSRRSFSIELKTIITKTTTIYYNQINLLFQKCCVRGGFYFGAIRVRIRAYASDDLRFLHGGLSPL